MTTSPPLAILFLLAASFSLGELFRHRGVEVASYIADREAQATHVLMNGGMAAMFAPFYDAAVGRVIALAYGGAIAVIAVRPVIMLVRRDAVARGQIAGSLYHALGLAAMIYAVRAMPMDMPAMPGMGAMHMEPAGGAVRYVLAAVFALDGVATAALVGFFPRLLAGMERRIARRGDVPSPDGDRLRLIRRAAFPHCQMDLGMVVMLLG